MWKRDPAEVMPGQMEKLIEATIETLVAADGAGSDLEHVHAHDTLVDFEADPFIEIYGRVDLPHLIRDIVAKWEEVRLP